MVSERSESTSSTVQALKRHYEEVKTLSERSLTAGETWYLIDIHWWNAWERYVGDSAEAGVPSANPGPINNAALLDLNTGKLRANLVDRLDYQLVPQDAWNLLTAKFGIYGDQAPIAREVVDSGLFVKHAKVEIYPLELRVVRSDDYFADGDSASVKDLVCSREEVLGQAYKEALCLLHDQPQTSAHVFDLTNFRLYLKHDGEPGSLELLENRLDTTLSDAGLCSGQLLVIDERKAGGTWAVPDSARLTVETRSGSSLPTSAGSGSSAFSPVGSTTRSGTVYNASGSATPTGGMFGGAGNGNNAFETRLNVYTPGVCGLSNLGNTCFMNSALQCMTHVPSLVRYFLGDTWETEINERNPLGMQGEMAKAFAELVRSMWSGRSSSVIPRNFKMVVGRFAPQFSGYQQQDSQELMAFLLDGLHEDLNRVREKPYVEVKEADGRPDAEVANEAWINYKKRNDSVVVDMFHGLLKSTLVCPECDKVSITFDPFCYLSLPLPMKKERAITVTYVPWDPKKELCQYRLTVPKAGRVQDMAEKLSQMLDDVPPETLVFADVYLSRFHKVMSADELISTILDRDDIFVYELPQLREKGHASKAKQEQQGIVLVQVMNRYERPHMGTYKNLIGVPMLLALPEADFDYGNLCKAIQFCMRRWLNEHDAGDSWWREEEKMETGDDSGVEENGNDDSQQGCSGAGGGKAHDAPPAMYTLTLTNTYGSTILHELNADSDLRAIVSGSTVYVGVDWHPMAAKKMYNEAAAKCIQKDESMTARAKTKTTSLGDCLELFLSTEQLGQDDLWYCPRCKKHQQATKKFDLWNVPDILIIHLKRFSYTRWYRDKIEGQVDFPTKGLDLQQWILNPSHPRVEYDLIGVSNHYGGLGGGHYTAFALNHEDGRWYSFDDSHPSPVGENEVVTKAGYVLVYRKSDGKSARVTAEPNVRMETD